MVLLTARGACLAGLDALRIAFGHLCLGRHDDGDGNVFGSVLANVGYFFAVVKAIVGRYSGLCGRFVYLGEFATSPPASALIMHEI